MASASAMTEPRTLEEMHARYREAQERNAAAARRLAEQRRAREIAPTPKAHFSAHDKAALDAQVYAILDPEKLAREPKRIIAKIAAAHHVSVGEILGPRRTRKVLLARHEAIAEVSDARPDLSLTTIGRIFHRDHTTILHALRRLGKRQAPGVAVTTATAMPSETPGDIIRAIAELHGISVAAIMGSRHTAQVVVARAAAIAAVSAEHPKLTTGDLARLFGRDPEVVRNAQRRHGLRPAVSSPALPRTEERSRTPANIDTLPEQP